MLKTRIITAVVLLLAFSGALFLTSVDVFALVLGFVVAACAWEWSRMCGLSCENGQLVYAALAGVLALIGLYIPFDLQLMKWFLLAGLLFWLAVPVLFYLAPPRQHVEQDMDIPVLALGAFMFLLTAVAMQYLRSHAPEASSWLLLYSLCVVWFMDIGAYFSGRRFGHRKLAPSISPGKSWEGVYGGLAATALLLIVVLLMADWTDGHGFKLLVATLLSAAASVLGDLYESRMKRSAGMKDSSQLLPGHGGVLDRLDGVLAAVPVFAFVWVWL
ncbi:phosphatidate cytidylyltransferase [Granulosicoccus antarcticus]|uniref:Phosphatidate cytidylyltransferase n=1 Tax=Granulosicoccus antarcticus IMCC3135 TaxID=1192854 RepID=A0A2Z2NV94_9GAMM|nr:phosphatidate cytidylyltransferase [Granulosicoccus antarcticus]ASJ75163.1 Phosphatidate cytidylyltransferase [Granulosicoccus antarcticus IMCC3135]